MVEKQQFFLNIWCQQGLVQDLGHPWLADAGELGQGAGIWETPDRSSWSHRMARAMNLATRGMRPAACDGSTGSCPSRMARRQPPRRPPTSAM
jgi:hypothetical protein